MFEPVETYSVIDDFETRGAVADREGQPRQCGVGVLDDVLEALLRDTIKRQLYVLRQSGVGQLYVEIDLGNGFGQARQSACQAEIVEHRRSQTTDRRTRLLEGQLDQFTRGLELLGRLYRIGANRPRSGVETIRQRDQPL